MEILERQLERDGVERLVIGDDPRHEGFTTFTMGASAVRNTMQYLPPSDFDIPQAPWAQGSDGASGWAKGSRDQALRPPIPWGKNNCGPQSMVQLVESTPLLAAAMEFKSSLLYGDGVVPIRRVVDEAGQSRVEPYYGWEEVNEFLRESDINTWFAEQCLDATVLGNVFPEIQLTRDRARISRLCHREAIFARHEMASPVTGEIEHIYMSAKWHRVGTARPDDLQIYDLLPRQGTLRALECKAGRKVDSDGVIKPSPGQGSYIVPVRIPTLGAPYYNDPWWLALHRSGWIDFAASIPRYKRAILSNGTTVRYMVKIHPHFWDNLFQQEGAVTQAEREAARSKWFHRLNDFLSNPENTGRAFVTSQTITGARTEDHITIEPIRIEAPGGELITDLEEVSNILAYGMGVHPSLIGASPGHSKSINGTEARELFIIKQSLLNPIRQRLLEPLRLVARYNKWPREVDFTVRNLELTTLDRHTGAVRSIGQDGVEP